LQSKIVLVLIPPAQVTRPLEPPAALELPLLVAWVVEELLPAEELPPVEPVTDVVEEDAAVVPPVVLAPVAVLRPPLPPLPRWLQVGQLLDESLSRLVSDSPLKQAVAAIATQSAESRNRMRTTSVSAGARRRVKPAGGALDGRL
jgi:hypothetical protein